MSDPITFVIQVMFGLLFAWSVWVAVRHRDRLASDVALVFAPIALVLGVGVLRPIVGGLPTWVGTATTLFLLVQPIFSLRLVSDIRGLPRWLLPVALGAIVIPATLLVFVPGSTALGVVAIGIFVVTELIAAGYLAIEARRRTGAARVRLIVAAIATSAVAAAILTLAAAAAGPTAVAAAGIVIRVVTLLAVVGYWIAFLPPRPLRRFWQGSAAFEHSEGLLSAPATTGSAELWAQLAKTTAALTGATTVVVLADAAGALRVAASSSQALEAGITYLGASLASLVGGDVSDPVMADLATRTDLRFGKVVGLTPEQVLIGAVVLLRPRPSLFDGDDADLVRALGIRSAHLVQRRAVLAEQEALGTRLAETVAALEAAGAAKSDFLASMSHELRTPLNAIIGFSSLMVGQPEVGGSLSVPREWVEHIRSGGDHLLALINDVLDLAKVESGRLELATEPVALGHAIADSVAGLRPLADRKNQHVEISVEPGGVIDADPGRLRQILYNLLSNAIKYTPEGGNICVSGSITGGEARIAVRDDGVGIDPADHGRVFEEFRQVGDPTQHQSGTGLGLAVTRRLVEAHGGRLDLESAPGVGSTFTVVLPARQRPASGVTKAPARGVGASEGAGRYVLLIEDEPSSVRLLQTYLNEAGREVRVAPDGESGLAAAAEDLPGAIVLDIMLPGIDGWEVLRRLKSDPNLRDVPVIVATVVDERGVGLALGAVDYLVKPIEPTTLLDRLDRYAFTTRVQTRAVRVLAIDDDAAALDVIEGTLEPLGFDVARAATGRDGILLAKRDCPDLVICDLMMPEVDGFQVIGELHDSPATSAIPILVLTAHDLSAAEKALLNGRVLGIATKGANGADGLTAWLARVLPELVPAIP